MMRIPFNRPYLTGFEMTYIAEAHQLGQLAGDGHFTKACSQYLEENLEASKVLLTTSATAALDMAALLLNIQGGDEVILPSYTFVSTANAFVLRGAVPVFVDIRDDTLNIDETKIEQAITPRTRAIVPVHYAGVSCAMDSIMEIADRIGIPIVEDAAQAIGSAYKGRPLGSIGDLGCLSFHETKNVMCGEGGALILRDREMTARAEILREKGTDRSRFFRGEVDRYTWVDVGSSFLPGEVLAAFLWAQLTQTSSITSRRLSLWENYAHELSGLEEKGCIRLPRIPDDCRHNGHIFHVLLSSENEQRDFLMFMRERGIGCVTHYVPLHSSDMGTKVGRVSGDMRVTDSVSRRVVRLPMWVGLEEHQDEVIDAIWDFFGQHR